MENIESVLKDVKAELGRISDGVKATAEDALKQAKDAGQLTGELKQKADELLTKQNELSARQLELEQKLEAGDRGKGKDEVKSLGQAVAEHDAVKSYVTNGASGSVKINVQNAITSANTSAGDLIWSDRETAIVGIPRRQLRIRDLLGKGRTTSNLVEYAKQVTRTNNARPVTEGEAKPESVYAWDRADAAVRTIAHIVHVSRQALDDAAQLQSEIDGELRYGLDLAEEAQLLTGSGAGQNLSGLITNATSYSAAFTPTDKTMIDDLRLAILQVALNEYSATGIVLHPTDWARIELTKDADKRLMISTPLQLAQPSLWGLPVVATQSISVDKFLVGAFAQAATIYDRMDTEVLISSEHGDNFVKNMYTLRAEKRLALAVKRSASLVYGDFGFVT